MVNGAVTFTTPALTTLGANAIVATYNGDTNYSAKAATSATVTVVATTAATVTVTAPATAQVGTAVSLVATVSAATATTAVYFYANGIEIGTANIVVATHTADVDLQEFRCGNVCHHCEFCRNCDRACGQHYRERAADRHAEYADTYDFGTGYWRHGLRLLDCGHVGAVSQ